MSSALVPFYARINVSCINIFKSSTDPKTDNETWNRIPKIANNANKTNKFTVSCSYFSLLLQIYCNALVFMISMVVGAVIIELQHENYVRRIINLHQAWMKKSIAQLFTTVSYGFLYKKVNICKTTAVQWLKSDKIFGTSWKIKFNVTSISHGLHNVMSMTRYCKVYCFYV